MYIESFDRWNRQTARQHINIETDDRETNGVENIKTAGIEYRDKRQRDKQCRDT